MSILFATLYVLTIPFPRRLQLRVQRLWCAGVAWSAGLVVRVEGDKLVGPPPVLYLVNHVSYFDIPAFGAQVDAVFVAKSEVADWPLFGWFSRLTGTVFIPRRAGRSAEQVRLLRRRLARGENLILFPEGTNSDGTAVLPFKSSLLAIATADGAGVPVRVQPVSLAYTHTRAGTALVGADRGLYAWVDADDMFPHLWRALGSSGAHVRIAFHRPLAPADVGDRKQLAQVAESRVRDGVRRLWEEAERRGG